MKKIIYLSIVTGLILFSSCAGFLDEPPSKTTSVEIKTVDHLDALFNDFNSFAQETNAQAIYGTDDVEFNPDLHDGVRFNITQVHYGLWDVPNVTLDSRPYWPDEWAKILKANLVLENVDDVTGDADKKAQLKAEAHFIRLYSYFQLANTYCLPYSDANGGELGLPIKENSDIVVNVERADLQTTWDFMEADLQEALALTASFGVNVEGINRTWRANTAAVNGFAARFYLAKNDYAKAQQYAQLALDEYSYLNDYNTKMYYSSIVSEVTIFNPDPVQDTILYPYTHDIQSITQTSDLGWGENYYFRNMNNPWWAYYPSQDLISLYDHDYDLRFKYHVVEKYSYDRGAVSPPYPYPGYIFFFKDRIPSGPSVAEMLLIKAECQVRQGQWSDGIQTTNELRVVRMDVNTPANILELSADSQADALTKVLQERRRELAIVHRWSDVRRFNTNEDPADDVVMTRTFYPFNSNQVLNFETPITYTMEKNSRRFACPIPDQDINASEGTLQQNTY